MSARVEAAAKAAYEHDQRENVYAIAWEDTSPELRGDYAACETSALSAADLVMFSEAAIERASVYAHVAVSMSEADSRKVVRAVVAALREGA
jgi:hypothetical protein